jgi:sugar lactone lactonase YvrE
VTLRSVLEGLHMPECPRWHGDSVWFTDVWGHQVLRLGPAGEKILVHEFGADEDPAGLGWLPDGRLLVVGMLGRVVYRLGGDGLVVHADLRTMTHFPLNDMVVADDGTAYVSGFGWDVWGDTGGYADNDLIRLRPDGSADVAAESMMAPNGMALTGDGRTLVVAEPAGGRLSRFRVAPDGALSDRVLVPLERAADADYVTPDGICLDADGAVWAADPMGRRVIRVLEDGEIEQVIEFDEGYPLACLLGGPARTTLFVAVGAATSKRDRPPQPKGRLVATTVDVPGDGRP